VSAAAGWVHRQLGYQAADPGLFERACTHRSATRDHNERLEFLGDAVLNVIVSEQLYRRYPHCDEGMLSRLRAAVVSGESLARVAAGLGLGAALQLGPGEMQSGGHRRESILADAFEALCGALFLEAGLARAREVLLQALAPALAAASPDAVGKDAKTRLQEWLQGRGLPLPVYRVLKVEGDPHAQHFDVSCEVAQLEARGAGSGSNRRRAEQAAAQQVLERLAGATAGA
jgi:ribonuclease-3